MSVRNKEHWKIAILIIPALPDWQLYLLCFFLSPWEDMPPMAGSGQCGSPVLQLRQMIKFKGKTPQLFVKLPLDSGGMVGADLFIFTCLRGLLAYRAWLTAYVKRILRWFGYSLNKTKMALSLNHVKRMYCAVLSRSVVSDSFWLHELPPTRLLYVHGISQARILEWVAISSSRGSSRPRDQTKILCFLHCKQILLLAEPSDFPTCCL